MEGALLEQAPAKATGVAVGEEATHLLVGRVLVGNAVGFERDGHRIPAGTGQKRAVPAAGLVVRGVSDRADQAALHLLPARRIRGLLDGQRTGGVPQPHIPGLVAVGAADVAVGDEEGLLPDGHQLSPVSSLAVSSAAMRRVSSRSWWRMRRCSLALPPSWWISSS